MDTRVAAHAVIVDAGHLLLAHWRSAAGTGWTLPGGGIDPGEHPADAVVREVREETGYDACIDELLGIDSLVVPQVVRGAFNRPVHGLRVIYRAHVTGGALRPEVGGSTDAATWVPLEQVDSLDRVDLVDAGRRLAGLLPVTS